MQKLKELQLYNKGLIEIKSKEMVGRYNAALEAIGLEPTVLKKFLIDGWGWSPEIAEEKKDNFYLSHGLANPYAIIINPEQEHVPVYMPYHSFDNRMLRNVFETFKRQIYDLTFQTAIIIECDQDISAYRSPYDLLGIEFFTMKFSTTDRLSEAKKAQMRLERKFYDEEHAWEDAELRNQLRSSYRKYGVLADKKFLLPDHNFTDVDSFYTRTFGGLFLFRNEEKLGQTLLIREDLSHAKSEHFHGQASNYLEYDIHELKLIEVLITKDMIGVYSKKLISQVEDLERILFLTLAEVIFEKEPDVDVVNLTSGQLKKRVNSYAESGDLLDHYFELESLISKVKKGGQIDPNKLSPKVYKLLMRPNPDLSKNTRWLLWRVIIKMNSFDLFRLYVYDKDDFYRLYRTWPQAKKDWAIQYITPRYTNSKNLKHS